MKRPQRILLKVKGVFAKLKSDSPFVVALAIFAFYFLVLPLLFLLGAGMVWGGIEFNIQSLIGAWLLLVVIRASIDMKRR